RIALNLELANLSRPGPCLIPRDINVVANLISVDGVGASVGEHSAEQLDLLRVGRDDTGRRFAVLANDDGVHAAIQSVAQVAGGMRAVWLRFLAGVQIFGRKGLKLPRPDLRSGASRMFLGGSTHAPKQEQRTGEYSFH